MPPRVHITSDDPEEFDETVIQHLKDEGFDVTYLPYKGDPKQYKWELAHLADDLELGENYALIGKPVYHWRNSRD